MEFVEMDAVSMNGQEYHSPGLHLLVVLPLLLFSVPHKGILLHSRPYTDNSPHLIGRFKDQKANVGLLPRRLQVSYLPIWSLALSEPV